MSCVVHKASLSVASVLLGCNVDVYICTLWLVLKLSCSKWSSVLAVGFAKSNVATVSVDELGMGRSRLCSVCATQF